MSYRCSVIRCRTCFGSRDLDGILRKMSLSFLRLCAGRGPRHALFSRVGVGFRQSNPARAATIAYDQGCNRKGVPIMAPKINAREKTRNKAQAKKRERNRLLRAALESSGKAAPKSKSPKPAAAAK